nr:hypothetical protein [Cellulomonas sp. HLT2-17]
MSQGPQLIEQLIRFASGQRRGRLVDDEEPSASEDAPNDLDELLVGDRQVRCPCIEVDRVAQRFHHRANLAPGGRAPTQRQLDVLQHGEVGKELRLLRHQIDAIRMRRTRSEVLDLASTDHDLTGVGRHHAGDDLHESGLAGSIAADYRVNLARQEIDADTLKHGHPAVGLPDVSQDRDWSG